MTARGLNLGNSEAERWKRSTLCKYIQHQPLMNNVVTLNTRPGLPRKGERRTVRQKNEANKGPAGDLGES